MHFFFFGYLGFRKGGFAIFFFVLLVFRCLFLCLYTGLSINYVRFQERQFYQQKVFLEMLGSFFEYADERALTFSFIGDLPQKQHHNCT
jgi:hypothetical protein